MNPLASILAQTRVQRIVQDVLDVQLLPSNTYWLGKIPVVSADEGEILARYEGRISIADIIADDASAIVKAGTPVTLEISEVPNLKHGRRMGQEALNRLRRLATGTGTAADDRAIQERLAQDLSELITGVRLRMESIFWMMATDRMSYDGLGIKLDGSFGMPADLKVTPLVQWSTPATATPIDDTYTLVNLGSQKYGVNYDRITLSTAALRAIIATQQYQDQVKTLRAIPVGAPLPAAGNMALHRQMLGDLLGLRVETFDGGYQTEGPGGSIGTARFCAQGDVVLSSTTADGSRAAWDFANGIVTESVVGQISGNAYGGFASEARGPVGYVTGTPDLNPPTITTWAVARGFARRHMKAVTAVLRGVI
ncbi:MAG: major capsid protein [Fimbriimonadaceae bacterium]|nr:major capsid protein [Fimbriimonadaceae bacterium]